MSSYVCKRPQNLNVILRPPKDLAVLPFDEAFTNIGLHSCLESFANSRMSKKELPPYFNPTIISLKSHNPHL